VLLIEPDKEVVSLIAELKQHGADLASAPETAVARLRQMREKGEISESALIQVLAQTPSGAAAQLLAEIAAGAHGAVRRAAKRALFRLRQRGVTWPTPPLAEQATGSESAAKTGAFAVTGAKIFAPASTIAYNALTALISPFDSTGIRLVWLFKDLSGGGVHRLWGVVSVTRGLVAVMPSRLPRRQLREERASVEQESMLKLVDAEPKLADFILCEAYRRTPQNDRGAVGNFLQLRAEIVAAPVPVEIDHPVYRELAAALDATPSPALLEEPVMAAFAPPQAELRPFAHEIEELRQSPLVLSSAQQQERFALIVDRALEHMLEGERKVLARRYLEDAAYYLARAGRSQAAQWAVAAAKILAAGGDVRRTPFFQRWIQASLSAAAADMAQREAGTPRLILTPAEARRAAASREARR
jgi:hypothetical protein